MSGVTATFGRGITTVAGPNGAGKSSLFRVLAGLQRPDSGSVASGRITPQRADEWQRLVGYLPQEPDFAGGVSVADSVALAGWLKCVPRAGLSGAVREALDRVGLADRAGDRVRSLSGGMRRRLGFATAVVHGPQLLVLDEPTAGLDPEQRSSLAAVTKALAANRIVLLSTHILDDLRQTGGQVAILSEGRLVFHGSIESLMTTAGERLERELDATRAGDLDLAYLSMQDVPR